MKYQVTSKTRGATVNLYENRKGRQGLSVTLDTQYAERLALGDEDAANELAGMIREALDARWREDYPDGDPAFQR